MPNERVRNDNLNKEDVFVSNDNRDLNLENL